VLLVPPPSLPRLELESDMRRSQRQLNAVHFVVEPDFCWIPAVVVGRIPSVNHGLQ